MHRIQFLTGQPHLRPMRMRMREEGRMRGYTTV